MMFLELVLEQLFYCHARKRILLKRIRKFIYFIYHSEIILKSETSWFKRYVEFEIIAM